MRPIKDRILVEYIPQKDVQTESGIYVTEDTLNFLELNVLKAGTGCENVKDGDTVRIRKESLFQTEYEKTLLFQTKEPLLFKINNKATNKYILFSPITETTTKSGLLIHLGADSKTPQKGVVIDCGEKTEFIKQGDTVLIGKNSTVKDGEYYWVHEDDVIGIVEED